MLLPLPQKASFSGNQGRRGKSSHAPAARPARGCRAAFLPLSHTSLHLCNSPGDVRSFFQLLQVSIKPAADSSMGRERQRGGNLKPQQCPLPMHFPGQNPNLAKGRGHPRLPRGLTQAGTLQGGGRLPHPLDEHHGAVAGAEPSWHSRVQLSVLGCAQMV